MSAWRGALGAIALLGSCGAEPAGSTVDASACGPYPVSGGSEASPGVRFQEVSVEEALRWTRAPELVFEVGEPATRGRVVEVRGVLRNDGEREVDAVYLTGGAMFASTNPFTVTASAAARPGPQGVGGPEVYPAPRRAVLPPGGEVRFVVGLCADLHDHAPGAKGTARWELQLWTGAHPSGEVAFTWP